jgi:hypothetical protein
VPSEPHARAASAGVDEAMVRTPENVPEEVESLEAGCVTDALSDVLECRHGSVGRCYFLWK